jgi:hypothetical protein
LESQNDVTRIGQVKGAVQELGERIVKAESYYRSMAASLRTQLEAVTRENEQLKRTVERKQASESTIASSKTEMNGGTRREEREMTSPDMNISFLSFQKENDDDGDTNGTISTPLRSADSKFEASLANNQKEFPLSHALSPQTPSSQQQQQQPQQQAQPSDSYHSPPPSSRAVVEHAPPSSPWRSLQQFCDSIGLPQYGTMLASFGFDTESIQAVTDDELRNMGVALLGHRKKILMRATRI